MTDNTLVEKQENSLADVRMITSSFLSQTHCPLSNNIPDWLKLTAEGRVQEAYELSQSTNNIPEVCGRILSSRQTMRRKLCNRTIWSWNGYYWINRKIYN